MMWPSVFSSRLMLKSKILLKAHLDQLGMALPWLLRESLQLQA